MQCCYTGQNRPNVTELIFKSMGIDCDTNMAIRHIKTPYFIQDSSVNYKLFSVLCLMVIQLCIEPDSVGIQQEITTPRLR